MQPEGLLPGLVTTSHLPCPKTDQTSPRPHNSFPENPFQYYPSIMPVSQVVST